MGSYPAPPASGTCNRPASSASSSGSTGHRLGRQLDRQAAPTSWSPAPSIRWPTISSYELDWYHQKVEAGADFAMTQPLYDLEQLDRFFSRVPESAIPTIVEIMPLQSYKHAEFCHNELAGVVIPDEHLRRMKEAGERGIDVGFRAGAAVPARGLPARGRACCWFPAFTATRWWPNSCGKPFVCARPRGSRRVHKSHNGRRSRVQVQSAVGTVAAARDRPHALWRPDRSKTSSCPRWRAA